MKRICLILLSAALLSAAACGVVSNLIFGLDAISIAASAAAPVAGQYAPYVALAAQFCTDTAVELGTAKPASKQAADIFESAVTLAAQSPDLTNATPQQKALIGAIAKAIPAFVNLLQAQLAPVPAGGAGSFMGRVKAYARTKPVPLTRADRKKLEEILKRHGGKR